MTKRILLIAGLLIASISISAQNRFENYPLPSSPDTLRILAIGNSFSDDGTEYVPRLLEASGIHNVIIARLYIGGCTLERHCKEYDGNLHDYSYCKSGSGNRWTEEKNATITRGIKDEPWDIITIQQASGYSGIYSTISDWAPKLISIIRKECTNPKAAIVWHQTWAYASNSHHGDFPKYGRDQQKMQAAIQDCVDNLTRDFNIQTVIPVGVAVKYARETRLNNKGKVPEDTSFYDLTRDGFHMSLQFGRYLAACTWYEALIKPTLGKSVKGNPYTLADTDFSITEKDARLCQKLAAKAVKEGR